MLTFASDLKRNLDAADAAAESIKDTIDEHIARNAMDALLEQRYTPVWRPGEPPRELDIAAAAIRSLVWCMGFDSE